jgi:hypothetical protein
LEGFPVEGTLEFLLSDQSHWRANCKVHGAKVLGQWLEWNLLNGIKGQSATIRPNASFSHAFNGALPERAMVNRATEQP